MKRFIFILFVSGLTLFCVIHWDVIDWTFGISWRAETNTSKKILNTLPEGWTYKFDLRYEGRDWVSLHGPNDEYLNLGVVTPSTLSDRECGRVGHIGKYVVQCRSYYQTQNTYRLSGRSICANELLKTHRDMHINEIVINYDEIIYELKTHLSETELRSINSRVLYSASNNLDRDSQETLCLLADVGNPNKKTQ